MCFNTEVDFGEDSAPGRFETLEGAIFSVTSFDTLLRHGRESAGFQSNLHRVLTYDTLMREYDCK